MDEYKELTDYRPKVKIHLYDKSEIITDQKHEKIIIEAWKKKAVITVGSITINGGNISKIEPLQFTDYESQVNFEIPGKYKKVIETRSKIFSERIGRYPIEETIKIWCRRLDNGEDLDPKG